MLMVDEAVGGARDAFELWCDRSLDERAAYLQGYCAQLERYKGELAKQISVETGKPLWESGGEVAAMIGKVAVSIAAYGERRAVMVHHQQGHVAATRYKPHGVVAVIGPFNLPGHLPNGHIVPALLAGNAVVFKPSEKTPAVGDLMGRIFAQAKLPTNVVRVVQGGREVGEALTTHDGIDGVYFTGSFGAGCAINRALADRPHKIVALEMGGNNPLVVERVADVKAAAYLTVLSAYITAGQRCSCARRLIVVGDNDAFINQLVSLIGTIRVGRFDDDPQPFMGPLIDRAAADRLLAAQRDLLGRGGQPLIEMKRVDDNQPAMLTPGLIDVTAVRNRADDELFGPLLQLIRVDNFDAAIDEANRTAYGLSAALFSDRHEQYEKFYRRIRAGVVNWNRQTTGASSELPFGGIGQSGNQRPSGYWATDYCSYPIASLEAAVLTMPQKLMPGITP